MNSIICMFQYVLTIFSNFDANANFIVLFLSSEDILKREALCLLLEIDLWLAHVAWLIFVDID